MGEAAGGYTHTADEYPLSMYKKSNGDGLCKGPLLFQVGTVHRHLRFLLR